MKKLQPRKKTLRLAVEDSTVPDTEASIDTLLFRHLETLSAIGGDSEWLRQAARSHFIRERIALNDRNIDGRLERLVSRD